MKCKVISSLPEAALSSSATSLPSMVLLNFSDLMRYSIVNLPGSFFGNMSKRIFALLPGIRIPGAREESLRSHRTWVTYSSFVLELLNEIERERPKPVVATSNQMSADILWFMSGRTQRRVREHRLCQWNRDFTRSNQRKQGTERSGTPPRFRCPERNDRFAIRGPRRGKGDCYLDAVKLALKNSSAFRFVLVPR